MQLGDERFDVANEINDVRRDDHVASFWRLHPPVRRDARVGNAGLIPGLYELPAHAVGRLGQHYLTNLSGQREGHAAGAPANVEQHVLGPEVSCDGFQVLSHGRWGSRRNSGARSAQWSARRR